MWYVGFFSFHVNFGRYQMNDIFLKKQKQQNHNIKNVFCRAGQHSLHSKLQDGGENTLLFVVCLWLSVSRPFYTGTMVQFKNGSFTALIWLGLCCPGIEWPSQLLYPPWLWQHDSCVDSISSCFAGRIASSLPHPLMIISIIGTMDSSSHFYHNSVSAWIESRICLLSSASLGYAYCWIKQKITVALTTDLF